MKLTKRQKEILEMLRQGHDICEGVISIHKFLFPHELSYGINGQKIKYSTFKVLKPYLRNVYSDNVGWWTLKDEYKND